jgi:DNA-binding transcriptional regulator PaaX
MSQPLALRPVSARNAVLTTLLATHPPTLAAGELVADLARLGFSESATRVALTRMVARGDLARDAGNYTLTERLQDRQRLVDEAQHPQTRSWRGTWEMAVVTTTGRSAADRAALRQRLFEMRVAELREGVWTRPANLRRDWPPELVTISRCFEARPLEDPAGLAAELWDLEGWASYGHQLLTALPDTADSPADRFTLVAAMVRHLQSDPLLPPVFSGLPTDDDSQWQTFCDAYDASHRELWSGFNEWVVEQGAPPLPELEFIHTSQHANLYLYPQAIDYQRSRLLDQTWQRLPSSVRATDEPFEVPATLEGDGALIYLSLGSLGSADVELMTRLVGVLADTPHRYIVSKGPRHAEIELAANMWGADVVPQTNVLPHVDLVITHGGNNTTTESLHFGKPMVVLPLFWDQYDNAQRVHEVGAGIRLDTYGFDDGELTGAIDRLLGDAARRRRMEMNGQRIRAANGTSVAADRIERVATTSR